MASLVDLMNYSLGRKKKLGLQLTFGESRKLDPPLFVIAI